MNRAEALAAYPNLRRANLRGADLRGAYLDGAYLDGAYLGGADLGGADLSGANLGGAYLRGANLRGADLGGADLDGADLSGAYLSGADLSRADLGGANLGGANLGGANLGGAYLSKTRLCYSGTWSDPWPACSAGNWSAWMVAPGVARIGCTTLSIGEWLGEPGARLCAENEVPARDAQLLRHWLLMLDGMGDDVPGWTPDPIAKVSS